MSYKLCGLVVLACGIATFYGNLYYTTGIWFDATAGMSSGIAIGFGYGMMTQKF